MSSDTLWRAWVSDRRSGSQRTGGTGESPEHLAEGRAAILDNAGYHRHENVQRRLRRHKRFEFHFIPASSSWTNLVERWFGLLTGQCVRRGVFHSVAELKVTIYRHLETHTLAPQPFQWRASVQEFWRRFSALPGWLELRRRGIYLLPWLPERPRWRIQSQESIFSPRPPPDSSVPPRGHASPQCPICRRFPACAPDDRETATSRTDCSLLSGRGHFELPLSPVCRLSITRAFRICPVLTVALH